ncbi:MAG TPA: prenyltransferase/squalene oxidase repeat-containing protein [Actinomycetota bacterium]
MIADPEAARFVAGCSSHTGVFTEPGEAEPTLEATRFGVEALVALGGAPRESVLDFVEACWRPDGGFAMLAGEAEISLAATYYALRLRELVGHADPARGRVTARWLIDRMLPGATGDADEGVDIDELYYALRSWQILGFLPTDSHRLALVNFMLGCAGERGGFGLVQGAASDIERTYCCVHGLRILGLDPPRLEVHRAWASACIAEGRFYATPERLVYSLPTMYWGSRTAELLGIDPDWPAVEREVLAFRRADGGFGAQPSSSLWETYCALGALRLATAMREGADT